MIFLEFLAEEGAFEDRISVANDEDGVRLHLECGDERRIDLAVLVASSA